MTKKKQITILVCLLLVFGLLSSPIQTAEAAITEITVDESEYNLWIEDIPSFTSEWNSMFAKLNQVSDASPYMLSLFDDTSSTNLLLEALEKANISAELENVYGMDIMIYKLDSDDEYYPVESNINATIICPIPDFWNENPEYIQLYAINTAGKAEKHAFSLVSIDGVACMKFTIKDTGVYGLVLQEKKADSSTEVSESTKAPTKNPTKAPTPKPTQSPAVTKIPTKVPERVEAQPNTKPQNSTNTETQPTKRPLDQTPETGDVATVGSWVLTACLSGAAIAGIIIYFKKQ